MKALEYYGDSLLNALNCASSFRRKVRTIWWDGFFVEHDRLVTGELTAVPENGATSGPGVLASFYYNDLGRRVSHVRGNGSVTYFGWDPVSRLAGMTHDFANDAFDLNIGTIAYNPAGQIVSQARSNDSYAWTGAVTVNRNYTANGLNQYTAAGPASFTYDPNGNLTSDGTAGFGYDSRNQLTSANGVTLRYDPLGRLTDYGAATPRRFVYGGVEALAEVSAAGVIVRRYVRGDGADELLVDYGGAGTGDRRWAHADERGSIVGLSDAAGNRVATNTYDEYGIPGSGNSGRFQYTGQMWLPEVGLYHYKYRAYSPFMGRFMQTDPIGFAGGINLYGYVGNDPVNFVDPLGLDRGVIAVETCRTAGVGLADGPIDFGPQCYTDYYSFDTGGGGGGGGDGGGGGGSGQSQTDPCGGVLTANPLGDDRTALNSRNAATGQGNGAFGTPRSRGTHSGIDITGPVGAPVFAAGDGTVVPIAPNPSSTYGIQVVIAHAGRVFTQYSHLSSSSARPGATVSAGDRIGAVGTTGNTPPRAQPHLHFEVRVGSATPRTAGGQVIDPQQCLPGGQ